MLVKYVGSNIKGIVHDTKPLEIFIDQDFIPSMNILNDTAKELHLTIIVIDAKRNTIHLPGAIVEPAKLSNHLIGHGVDVNIQDTTGHYYNSHLLQDSTGVVRAFIEKVKVKGLRWGGDFHTQDPVHFDDGLNVLHPELYHQKYNEYFVK